MTSTSLLLRGAERVVTQNIAREERIGADVLLVGDEVRAIGESLEAPEGAEVLDCSGCVILPGLINGHHHLFQSLTRALPGAQDHGLFDWLGYHYPIWAYHDSASVAAAARVGLAELLLTGCTSTADHHYLFPREADPHLLDHTIEAARELGIRFHPTRGSMSRGESQGGLAPDAICQSEAVIMEDCERVIAAYHDASPRSMLRIGLGPCAPFSVSPELMKESATLARKHGLRLHTHLCETQDEEEYCGRVFGKRPFEFMEEVDWEGPDVWYAHGIHLSEREIEQMGETGVGVAHCPSSNKRLGSGTAPVQQLLEHHVPVGLGVDGSASNDSSDMLGEVRSCMLAHRQVSGPGAMTARRALRLATWGGARILGRTDQLGSLEVGKAADLAVFRVDGLGLVGAGRDPVAGLIFSGFERRAWATIVGGQVVVREGRLVSASEDEIVREGNLQAETLLGRAGLL
jgi:cytosine/adenosine deaminase-related metal-dependent hydrolase